MQAEYRIIVLLLIVSLAVFIMPSSVLADGDEQYVIQPGDVLQVSVWHEPDLGMEMLVRPDGRFSIPLVGVVDARHKTISQLKAELTVAMSKYIPDADVHLTITQLSGNKIYVIGKVLRPGEFMVLRPTDIMQILSIAGGPTRFADVSQIKVLRRSEKGQLVFPFHYNEVEKGIGLDQNIVLHSGDVVVVP